MLKTLTSIAVTLTLFATSVAQDMRELASRIRPSVVEIQVQATPKDKYMRYGTGWLYGNQHTVVTAAHVVEGKINGVKCVFDDGQSVQGVLVKSFTLDDVAVIHLDKEKVVNAARPLLRLAAKEPPVGAFLGFYGYPLDYPMTWRHGYVAHYTTLVGGGTQQRRMGYEVLGGGGFSGSPVFNEFGDVIGMHVQRDTRLPGFNFAVPLGSLMVAFKALGI